jgi:hypothetical protein
MEKVQKPSNPECRQNPLEPTQGICWLIPIPHAARAV